MTVKGGIGMVSSPSACCPPPDAYSTFEQAEVRHSVLRRSLRLSSSEGLKILRGKYIEVIRTRSVGNSKDAFCYRGLQPGYIRVRITIQSSLRMKTNRPRENTLVYGFS
jgi:hypothetical protein